MHSATLKPASVLTIFNNSEKYRLPGNNSTRIVITETHLSAIGILPNDTQILVYCCEERLPENLPGCYVDGFRVENVEISLINAKINFQNGTTSLIGRYTKTVID